MAVVNSKNNDQPWDGIGYHWVPVFFLPNPCGVKFEEGHVLNWTCKITPRPLPLSPILADATWDLSDSKFKFTTILADSYPSEIQRCSQISCRRCHHFTPRRPRTSHGSAKLALQRFSDPANLSLDWRTVTRDLPRNSPRFEGFGALGAPYLGRFRGLPFRPGPAGFKAGDGRSGIWGWGLSSFEMTQIVKGWIIPRIDKDCRSLMCSLDEGAWMIMARLQVEIIVTLAVIIVKYRPAIMKIISETRLITSYHHCVWSELWNPKGWQD